MATVRPKIRVLPTVIVLALSGCGGSSGTTTAPSPTPVAANIAATGDPLNITSCAGTFCTGFNFRLTNTGPGCASTLDLAGTITLTKADGTVSTAEWELTLGDKTAGIFRPGEVRIATRSNGSLTDTPGAGTYSFRVTKQTNVRC